MLYSPLEPLLQRYRVVVALVTRRVEQSDRLVPGLLAQACGGGLCRLLLELAAVSGDKLLPFCRLIVKPVAQRVAWRDVFEPLVDMRFRLGDAPRPQPIDQHAKAVVVGGGLV